MTEAEALRDLGMLLLKDARTMTLFLLLIMAAVIDVRSYRIPNWLNASGATLGLAFCIGVPAAAPHGIWWSLQGLLTGLVLMLPLYALRVTGAGDAKLMAVVGLFLGAGGVLQACLISLVVGGVLAVGYGFLHGALGQLMQNLKVFLWTAAASIATGARVRVQVDQATSIGRLPLAVSIALGTIGYVLAVHFGLP